MKKASAPALLPAKVDPPPEAPAHGLESWAMIELFGHQRIVGRVTVDPVEFPGMIRVDVPDLEMKGTIIRPGHTRYLGRGSVYAVNPCDEATVRTMLPHVDGLPARPMSRNCGCASIAARNATAASS